MHNLSRWKFSQISTSLLDFYEDLWYDILEDFPVACVGDNMTNAGMHAYTHMHTHTRSRQWSAHHSKSAPHP